MTTRWKSKSELIDLGREVRITLALYGDDNLPIERHVLTFLETDDKQDVAAKLHALADEIGTS